MGWLMSWMRHLSHQCRPSSSAVPFCPPSSKMALLQLPVLSQQLAAQCSLCWWQLAVQYSLYWQLLGKQSVHRQSRRGSGRALLEYSMCRVRVAQWAMRHWCKRTVWQTV